MITAILKTASLICNLDILAPLSTATQAAPISGVFCMIS